MNNASEPNKDSKDKKCTHERINGRPSKHISKQASENAGKHINKHTHRRLSKHTQTIIEAIVLLIVPITMALCTLLQFRQTAIITLLVVIAALLIFFISYEKSRPALQQIMPTVVLAAIAIAGRLIFYYVPYVKPVSAICIIAGVVFGKRSGFMVGALAALVSNIFFGQGPWTPWQMYSWGLIGYLAGVLGEHLDFFWPHKSSQNKTGATKNTSQQSVHPQNGPEQGTSPQRAKQQGVRQKYSYPLLYVYGFLSALLYGFILNSYYIFGFVQPLTLEGAALAYGAGLPFDLLHGVSTVCFLVILYAPWTTKLKRIKEKYTS